MHQALLVAIFVAAIGINWFKLADANSRIHEYKIIHKWLHLINFIFDFVLFVIIYQSQQTHKTISVSRLHRHNTQYVCAIADFTNCLTDFRISFKYVVKLSLRQHTVARKILDIYAVILTDSSMTMWCCIMMSDQLTRAFAFGKECLLLKAKKKFLKYPK